MKKTEKMVFTNNTNQPLLLILQPKGEDFTLLAGEEVEIITEDCEKTFYYWFNLKNNSLEIWGEGDIEACPSFYINGLELSSGHNREFNPFITKS